MSHSQHIWQSNKNSSTTSSRLLLKLTREDWPVWICFSGAWWIYRCWIGWWLCILYKMSYMVFKMLAPSLHLKNLTFKMMRIDYKSKVRVKPIIECLNGAIVVILQSKKRKKEIACSISHTYSSLTDCFGLKTRHQCCWQTTHRAVVISTFTKKIGLLHHFAIVQLEKKTYLNNCFTIVLIFKDNSVEVYKNPLFLSWIADILWKNEGFSGEYCIHIDLNNE